MKKVFISVPMKDRTDENIVESMRKMTKLVEVILGEEIEAVTNWFPGGVEEIENQKNSRIRYLSKAIEKIADCDMVATVTGWKWRGCQIEREVAERYDIPVLDFPEDYVMPERLDTLLEYGNGIVMPSDGEELIHD